MTTKDVAAKITRLLLKNNMNLASRELRGGRLKIYRTGHTADHPLFETVEVVQKLGIVTSGPDSAIIGGTLL